MAKPHPKTTHIRHSAGPVRDSEARRVCTLSGIAAAKEKLITLSKLRDCLDRSIRELEAERRKEEIVNKAFLTVRFTKATCDAFIGMASALGSLFLPKLAADQADKIEKLYATGTPIAEAAGTAIAGDKVDWVKTGAAVAKDGVSLVTENKGYEILTKSTAVKVDIINSALNNDKEAVVKSAASYVYDLHTTLGEMVHAKRAVSFAKIAKAGFEYNEQLGKAFDDMLQIDQESRSRTASLKTNLLVQARRVSAVIYQLEQFLLSCEAERPAATPASVNLG